MNEMEQYSAVTPSPVLNVIKDGTVIYSNEAGEHLLIEWGAGVGEKLPSNIVDTVQRVLSRNNPEKMEVKAGKKAYLVVFHPLTEQKCVSISGFDISDQKEVEEKLRESEKKYRNIVETSVEGIWIFNAASETTYVNEKMAKMLGYTREEIIGRFIWDFAYEEDKGIFQVKLVNRKQGIDEVYELKLIRKDGLPLWFSVSAKALFDDAGKFAGSVGMFTDITERKRAEETLAFERSQLLSIFDGIDDVVYVTDPYTYEVLYANKAMKKKFGSKLMGGLCYQEFQRKDSPCDFCTNQIILKERNKPYYWEYYNPIVNRYFIIMDRIIKWPDGRDVRFEIAIDITERKRAEEALKKAHDNLEEKVKERTSELEKAYNLLKESEKGLAEAQKTAHIGNYDNNLVANELYWSDELYRIIGLKPQEGMTYERFLTYVHPDDRDYVYNSTNEAFNGNVYAINYRIIRPDGEERTIHSERKVVFDEKNNPVRIKGTLQDITEYKKAEERLRESEEKYRNIVEIANEGISILDSEGKFTFINRKHSEMLGYSEKEIYGKYAGDFVEDVNLFKKEFEKRQLGVSKSYELKLVRKDGSPIWVVINAKSLFDDDGKFKGSLSMLTDITERKKAEKMLANFDIARQKEIHHRIKNNLQIISSLLDLQAEKFENIECIKYSDVLEAFKESQDRVISMALIHEELYKGGGSEALNFSQYVEKLSDNLLQTYIVGTTDISLKLDLEENIFFDMDTAVPLGMIVNELVSNSFKHAFQGRENGEIQIKLQRGEIGSYLKSENENFKCTTFELTVSDNGVGIPENIDIENLDSLGLQLVTSLVDQLDGELELERNNGTEFNIRFTVRENNDQALSPAQQQLVDDE